MHWIILASHNGCAGGGKNVTCFGAALVTVMRENRRFIISHLLRKWLCPIWCPDGVTPVFARRIWLSGLLIAVDAIMNSTYSAQPHTGPRGRAGS